MTIDSSSGSRRPTTSGGPVGATLPGGDDAFRLLVEAVQDYAIFLLGPDGRVLTWNLGAERIKGYRADEIIGRHFSVFYTPEEREAGRPMRLLAWAADHGRFEDQGWRVRKDGSRFWADVIVTVLRGADGVPAGYAKVTRDLTERRESERRERELLAEQRARAAAEEALQARDRFLSIASHELKTPAASLLLTVESMIRARDAGRLDDERLATSLRRVATATNRLGALISELLDVSRLQAGSATILRTPTDLVAIVRDVIERFGDVEEHQRIRLDAPRTATVLGDASLLDQVASNLVDNAVKYSPRDAPIEVAVEAAPDGGVTMTVADRGMGLDEEATRRLYQAFGRGDNAEHIPGLGLGLYITRQIVERHHGRIEGGPRANGGGSVFRVWLPDATE